MGVFIVDEESGSLFSDFMNIILRALPVSTLSIDEEFMGVAELVLVVHLTFDLLGLEDVA